MYKTRGENVLDRLASVLGLRTHKALADRVNLKLETIKSFRLGRRRITEKAAKQIELHTGISHKWLIAGDESAPMTNYRGEKYTYSDFEKAQKETDPVLKDNGYMAKLTHMELLEAHAIMIDILNSFKGDPDGAYQFMRRVELFVRREEMQRRDVHAELQRLRGKWHREKVASRILFPQGFLFPFDPEIFDRIRAGTLECKKAYLARMDAIAHDPNVQDRVRKQAMRRLKL
jgi:hypothetical protein